MPYAMFAVGVFVGVGLTLIHLFVTKKTQQMWYNKELAKAKLDIYAQKKSVDEKMERLRQAYPEMSARQAKVLEDELGQSGIFSSRQRR